MSLGVYENFTRDVSFDIPIGQGSPHEILKIIPTPDPQTSDLDRICFGRGLHSPSALVLVCSCYL